MRGLLTVLALLTAAPAWAAHAYAQFGDIKYPPGFTHFGYVNPNAPKGGEIRMVPPTRPTNFDKFNPFTLKGTPPHGIGGLMFESLLTGNFDEPTTAYGLLAEDVEVAADGMSATFRLNPKARFHDGKPVLAADVVHSFKTLTSKEAAPQFRTIYAEVKGATAVDERTVRFDFASANRELPLVVGVASPAVPEPASIIILLMGVILAVSHGRRLI
jgi:microcin C transport system substrate-binding protein